MIYKVCGKQKYLYPELLSISGFYWTLANLSAAGTSACLIVVLAIIVVASYLNRGVRCNVESSNLEFLNVEATNVE